MENYAKTILSSYMQLNGVITQIENLIKKKAKNSFYLRCDVVSFSEQLIALGEIRKDLIELKQITETVLNSIKPYDKILICYKYFGIVPQIEEFDHTSRNYFRKQVKALENFAKKLIELGYNEEWFKTKYLKIAFISGVYQTTLLEQGKKHVR